MTHFKNMLSIVVPVFNEQENIRPFYNALIQIPFTKDRPYELIFVDDGSSDETTQTVSVLATQDPRVKLLKLSRNFGHQSALTAGYQFASGGLIVSIDGDLQHPPGLITEMLQLSDNGYEVIFTARLQNERSFSFKTLTSSLFYRIFNRFSDITLSTGMSDYRLMSRKALNALLSLDERTRFLRGMSIWIGFKSITIHYTPERRHSGVSKYSLTKMISLAIDGTTSFSTKPLRLLAVVGSIITLFSILYAFYAIIQLTLGHTITGWTSILVTSLMLGGFQLIATGILGIYLGKIFDESKKRPHYIVDQKIGFNDESQS